SIARITGCDLFIGHFQIGILLINVGRSFVGDNVIRVAARPSNAQLLTSLDYRARLRKNLLTTAFFGALPNPVPAGVNASVTLGAHSVHFHTLPALTTSNRANNAWQTSVANTPPASINSPHALFRLLERKANRALLAIPENGLAASIRNAAQGLLNQDTVVGL